MKKTCNKCKQEKDLTEFYRDKQTKDGKKNRCKVCVKACVAAYRKANSEKLKAKNAAYRAYHKEIKQLQEEAGFETT